MPWLTADDRELDDLWPGHVDFSEGAKEILLEAAAIQCETYLDSRYPARARPYTWANAPRRIWDEATGTWIDQIELPRTWILAQALQAKALSNSGMAGADDELGGFGDTVTVFPMDWNVKNLLRPKGGISIA